MTETLQTQVFHFEGTAFVAAYFQGKVETYHHNRDGDGIDMFHRYAVKGAKAGTLDHAAGRAVLVEAFEQHKHWEAEGACAGLDRFVETQEYKGHYTVTETGRVAYHGEYWAECDLWETLEEIYPVW